MSDLAGILAAQPEVDRLKRANRDLGEQVARLSAENALLRAVDGVKVSGPSWAQPTARAKNRATGLLMLSDLHLDEVVEPGEVAGLNAFNRQIAEQRLQRVVDGAIRLSRDLMAGWSYDGLVLLLGGDTVSGMIHDELKETNEAFLPATIDYWIDPLCSAVATLADHFGKVHIVGTVGNHGRNTRKPRAKGRVQDSWDWLLHRLVARHFKDDKRVAAHLPDSPDAYFEVYGHRHCLTHGDQARGGSGISGLLTPVSLLDHRKRKRDTAAGQPYSHLWLGHWHSYMRTGAVTINGSIKGTDEYAYQGNFGHEPPSQAFAVLTPEHNVTVECAVYCEDREREGW